jgi:hypothetical protein
MNVRRPSLLLSRSQTTTPTNLLTASTTSWYTQWKARQAAEVPAVEPAAEPPVGGDGPDALAQWLAGDTDK